MKNLLRPPRRAAPYNGLCALSGTTARAGQPDAPAAAAPVLLSVSYGFSLAQATVSDGAGNWAFYGLKPATLFPSVYAAIAYDPTGQYDPACKTHLIPSPMPPDPDEH